MMLARSGAETRGGMWQASYFLKKRQSAWMQTMMFAALVQTLLTYV